MALNAINSLHLKGLSRLLFQALLVVSIVLFLIGCAEKVVSTKPVENSQDYVWKADEGPAIRWVKEIRNSRDTGLKEGFMQHLKNFLFGREVQGIARPYSVYADGSKQLCVSDPGAGVFHLYDIEKGKYRIIEEYDGGMLASPVGVTGDGKETLFLTDSALGKVFRYDLQEHKAVSFTQGRLERPTGIVFNPGNWLLYVSDTLAHQIVVFNLAGVELFRFGQRGAAPGDFNYPTDLWIDDDGRLLVTDSLNARIQVFTPQGDFLEVFGIRGHGAGYLDKPKGVATDSSGYMYISDALKDSVQIFADGRYLLQFGSRGQGPGQFWMPAGIFIRDNMIYVADSYNNRIQVFERFTPEGNSGQGKEPAFLYD